MISHMAYAGCAETRVDKVRIAWPNIEICTSPADGNVPSSCDEKPLAALASVQDELEYPKEASIPRTTGVVQPDFAADGNLCNVVIDQEASPQKINPPEDDREARPTGP
ncbi:MAG: hypothetical protein JO255_16085 [Alphaproteobacteria bacterium]|nr:hypothetical protein [Alphaproteobacteria bacterium]